MYYEGWVVVGLDLASDDTGVSRVFGPWSTYREADSYADYLCENSEGWVRGKTLHVHKVEGHVPD